MAQHHLHHPIPCPSNRVKVHQHLLTPIITTLSHSYNSSAPSFCTFKTWVKFFSVLLTKVKYILTHTTLGSQLLVPSLLLLILLLLQVTCSTAQVNVIRDTNYNLMVSLIKEGNRNNDSTTRMKLHRAVASHIEHVLWQVDRLQELEYGVDCNSVGAEEARHNLTDLVAKVTQTPSEELIAQIESKEKEILKSGKLLCDYSRGLSCDPKTLKCSCYTGHRHEDISYEPVREGGSCKLDEMSRCYSPSYLVSRGAIVVHCVQGSKCVGDLSGRRCISPVMGENCHCQKPCPDGSYTNLLDELKKCISKLGEISILGFNESCVFEDQIERDEVVQVLETSGSEKAGPIIRGIKRLLASNRTLCSPQEQLVCSEGANRCACGPEKDGIIYERGNGTCLWSKGSRCFPEDIYANVTGSNGSCVLGTECLMEGEITPCDPNFEEPLCYCQDPKDLESSGVVVFLLLAVVVLGAGGVVGFLVHAKIISCPPGSSPANV